VITTFQAYDIVRRLGSKQGPRRLRHPTLAQTLDVYGKPKKLVMRLMIDDCVRLELDGNKKTLRVVKITGNGQVFMAPVHEANVDKRNSDKTDPFAYVSKYAGSFQKAKARRITISPIGELHDPGF
jgi:CRISPR-associated protein, csn1 family